MRLRGLLNRIRYSSPTPSGPLHMMRVIALSERVDKSTTDQADFTCLFFIAATINDAHNAVCDNLVGMCPNHPTAGEYVTLSYKENNRQI